ncbi:MAG: geranylgeranyl reductase family protein [Candidatus Brachytrichaceae bacterium NZ_4S206]|jgi:geranylgeranyl reductase family protein
MYDVAIIGAGPGGSATAHYLAQRGVNVLLVDKADFPRDKTCGDGLTPRAVSVLQEMGLVEDLRRVGHVIRRFEVFAPNGRATGDAVVLHNGMPDYALVVPRLILDDHIRRRAVQSGARFEPHVHVNAVHTEGSNDASHVEIQGERDGRHISFQARLAVIATGANTRLLLRTGILRAQPRVIVAARAYFENVYRLTDAWTLRFDGAPLPGYGWVFPIALDAANVGVGYFKHDRTASALGFFESFRRSPAMQRLLEGARQAGPVRGYPLREDFLTAPTFGERILLVGEAAGLVNPLTGEGIDYALESGRIAAGHAYDMLERGDFTAQRHTAYDRALRERFQALFEFCVWVRRWCQHPFALNALVAMANRRDDLRRKLTSAVLGGIPIRGRPTVSRVIRALIRQG